MDSKYKIFCEVCKFEFPDEMEIQYIKEHIQNCRYKEELYIQNLQNSPDFDPTYGVDDNALAHTNDYDE